MLNKHSEMELHRSYQAVSVLCCLESLLSLSVSILLSLCAHINSVLYTPLRAPVVRWALIKRELNTTLFCSYGLLGPSGCGKTTLLKCIVGTLKISRGHITVLGKPPAFPGHGVPGRMVGYMPQVPTRH